MSIYPEPREKTPEHLEKSNEFATHLSINYSHDQCNEAIAYMKDLISTRRYNEIRELEEEISTLEKRIHLMKESVEQLKSI